MNAVITGATKGIGQAITLKFVEEGFDVGICARSSNDLSNLQNKIEASNSKCEVLTYPCDVSVKKEVLAFAEMIKDNWNQVDVLVNNAGFFTPGHIYNEEDGMLEKMIGTNLYGAYHLTRALISNMIKERSGHIFNICSTASITPYHDGGSYCISKYALLGFSKVLREEMKPYNVKVSSILPGATFTDSWKGIDTPSEEFIQPEDIASIIYNAYTLSAHTVMEEIIIRPQCGDIDTD